jgi:phosphoribosylaminoimidazole-succinocarboxamide synthase
MRPMPDPAHVGKVRDLYLVPSASTDVYDAYDLGGGLLLLVATDEMDLPIANIRWHFNGRGVALAALTRFWAAASELGLATNVVTDDVELPGWVTDEMRVRSVIVRRPALSPVNWVVASHLVGPWWEEYRLTGKIYAMPAPAGMVQYQELPELLIVPTMWDTDHQLEMAVGRMRAVMMLGGTEVARVMDLCRRAYVAVSAYAAARDVTLLDTIFGIGTIGDELVLSGSVFTPDQSRMAPSQALAAGQPAPDEDGWLRHWAAGVNREPDDAWPPVPGWVGRRVRHDLRTLCLRLTGSSPI